MLATDTWTFSWESWSAEHPCRTPPQHTLHGRVQRVLQRGAVALRLSLDRVVPRDVRGRGLRQPRAQLRVGKQRLGALHELVLRLEEQP